MSGKMDILPPELQRIPETFPQDLWNKLASFSLPYLAGREGFEHHTITAVHLANEVAAAALTEGVVDKDVSLDLITIAFLHDLGYATIDAPVYSGGVPRVTDRAKIDHQEQSAILAKRFFQDNQNTIKKYFTPEQQTQLIELIRVHDSLEQYDVEGFSNRKLLQLFNEVDSLAAIDMRFGKPNFPKDRIVDWILVRPMGGKKFGDKVVLQINPSRTAHFVTTYSKNKYVELVGKIFKYANSTDI
jgi:hypothetical protein